MSNLLSINALTVFDKQHKTLLSDVTLDIAQGEIVGIVGPNGSGKSTLLRAIAGLIPAKGQDPFMLTLPGTETRTLQGNLLLDGLNIGVLAPSARRLSLIRQDMALLPFKTALENIALPLMLNGKKSDAMEQARQLGKELGIERWLDTSPASLSGGTQRRVSIARALLTNPKILLCDEPLANLDVTARDEVLELLSNLARTRRMSLLFVSHEPVEAARICDRVMFLNEGKVHQVASWQEAWNKPASPFVARMTGRTVIVEGTLNADGCFAPRGCSQGWNLPSRMKNLFTSGASTIQAWLAGLPEDFVMHGQPTPNAIAAKVESAWFDKGRYLMRTVLEGGEHLELLGNAQIRTSQKGYIDIGSNGGTLIMLHSSFALPMTASY